MKIVLTGGGTAGSVTPLLAILEELRSRESSVECLFVGTRRGEPEKRMIDPYNVTWSTITSGKLRRYWSPVNFIAPFAVVIGFFQALVLFARFRPDCIVSAGGYVGVPCVWAGWVLGIRIVLHQPDLRPGLATMLTYRFAHEITTGFLETSNRFPGKTARWTGVPVRKSLTKPILSVPTLNLPLEKPFVLILGGGTGSMTLNNLALEVFLIINSQMNLLLVSGKGKQPMASHGGLIIRENLTADEMNYALSHATVIVSRAGANAIFEAASVQKPLILVPLPHSPQIANTDFMVHEDAALHFEPSTGNAEKLCRMISSLETDPHLRARIIKNAYKFVRPDAARNLANIIFSLAQR